ncbi:transposase [Cognatiyoonia sp. IB215182]|uniref:transposase n=1 Tax=Cognatiyoonia sp. IB215182 TaxID=3097353 RepID=UPI002A0D3E8E|nr:transposase [Cognatiyoonia sp. IB215182]MDX8355419.1 transposase [Cognatiyoonia sp. IB215182]
MGAELRDLLDRQIAKLEARIERLIAADEGLAETASILRSVPGIGPIASTMLISEMPELGQITGDHAVALTGLAPIASTRQIASLSPSAQGMTAEQCAESSQ